MTSIKVKFRPSSVADREGTIYYLISNNRRSRRLNTVYKVFAHEWDARLSTVTADRQSERWPQMCSIRKAIAHDLIRFKRIERRMQENDSEISVDFLIDEFMTYVHDYTLLNYIETIIGNLRRNGKTRTAETYRATRNSIKMFLTNAPTSAENGRATDIMLDEVTTSTMQAYEAWLKTRGLTQNSTSFYMRILRAVYNRAVEDGAIENSHPFRHVFTGVEKTVKRAVPLAVIRKIKTLDLSERPNLDFARDMFLMSFYLRGMSFIDMAYLRKSDLCNGYISYRRRKTGQLLFIEWTREMQLILKKYPSNQSAYLLPIIRNATGSDRNAYLHTSYVINQRLKQIARMVGVAMPLTLYVARHSWASAAKAKGIPLSVISEGLGHDNERTTQIYLASFDTSVVDKANSLIIKSLG